MKRSISAQAIVAASSAFSLALLISACGASAEDGVDQVSGGGPADGGMAAAQALAPGPAGSQHSHQKMREVLEESAEGVSITDTDDWWESLRDLNRELHKLRVTPTECKAFVTASALPVPTGALASIAEHGQRQTVVYSFEDNQGAQDYVQQETDGVDQCHQHRVIRDLNDQEVSADTTLEEVELRSGAEDSLAVSSRMEADDQTQHGLAVLLRYEATVVGAAETLEEPLGQSEAEELATDLEAEAAAVLSALTGEEIIAAEPEPESEPEADSDEESADADGENEDGDGEEFAEESDSDE